MPERPGDPTCICGGTGLVTTSRDSAHGRSPEVCDCVARLAREDERTKGARGLHIRHEEGQHPDGSARYEQELADAR